MCRLVVGRGGSECKLEEGGEDLAGEVNMEVNDNNKVEGVEKELLFSSSFGQIKVWDLETWKCVKTLKGHSHWVRALYFSEMKLFSGCHNLIKVWDTKTFSCIQNINGSYGSIYSLISVGNYLLAGIYEKVIMVFSLENYETVKALAGHAGGVYALCSLGDEIVFSGSYDAEVKIWNMKNMKCVQTLRRHQSSVEALKSDEYNGDFIFSASSDKSIKMFRPASQLPLNTIGPELITAQASVFLFCLQFKLVLLRLLNWIQF